MIDRLLMKHIALLATLKQCLYFVMQDVQPACKGAKGWHDGEAMIDARSFKFKYVRGRGWQGDAAIGAVEVFCA